MKRQRLEIDRNAQKRILDLEREVAALKAENKRLRVALRHEIWRTHEHKPCSCDACTQSEEALTEGK